MDGGPDLSIGRTREGGAPVRSWGPNFLFHLMAGLQKTKTYAHVKPTHSPNKA